MDEKWESLRANLATHLRSIREELYGEHGAPLLADKVGVPQRIWHGFETGMVVPAEIILRFIEVTGSNPHWLYTGEGPRYVSSNRDDDVLD